MLLTVSGELSSCDVNTKRVVVGAIIYFLVLKLKLLIIMILF